MVKWPLSNGAGALATNDAEMQISHQWVSITHEFEVPFIGCHRLTLHAKQVELKSGFSKKCIKSAGSGTRVLGSDERSLERGTRALKWPCRDFGVA